MDLLHKFQKMFKLEKWKSCQNSSDFFIARQFHSVSIVKLQNEPKIMIFQMAFKCSQIVQNHSQIVLKCSLDFGEAIWSTKRLWRSFYEFFEEILFDLSNHVIFLTWQNQWNLRFSSWFQKLTCLSKWLLFIDLKRVWDHI